MSSLSLRNVCKSFGEVEVLRNINIEVEEGEFVIFVGPSGCGKSTLLRVIAGLEDATSGDVEIGGERMNEKPPAKRGISMVFQSYALYPHLTVRGNMSLGLKQAKRPKGYIKERVDLAAEMLDLTPYLDRRPAELSGGQRQRVAIGRSIVRKPKLFLFDEPLSNLDAALRVNTRLEIARIHRELKASMIYVTHDQVEAMTLADKIVVLRDGRVEQIGSPMQLYNDPDNLFVAGFLGSPSMNFLKAGILGLKGPVTAGIRPEHLSITETGPISGEIAYVELLGSDTNVYVHVEGADKITVRLFGQHQYKMGERVSLDYQAENLFLFDADAQRIR